MQRQLDAIRGRDRDHVVPHLLAQGTDGGGHGRVIGQRCLQQRHGMVVVLRLPARSGCAADARWRRGVEAARVESDVAVEAGHRR